MNTAGAGVPGRGHPVGGPTVMLVVNAGVIRASGVEHHR